MYQMHAKGIKKKSTLQRWSEMTTLLLLVWKTANLSQPLSDWQTLVLKQLGLVQNFGAAGHRGGAWERGDIKWKWSREKPEATPGRPEKTVEVGGRITGCGERVGGGGVIRRRALNDTKQRQSLKCQFTLGDRVWTVGKQGLENHFTDRYIEPLSFKYGPATSEQYSYE